MCYLRLLELLGTFHSLVGSLLCVKGRQFASAVWQLLMLMVSNLLCLQAQALCY